ncbi:MAG TPA: glycosyltransferase [Bryobacteraceae bacterium]|jgi:glycosyltransferase involved in cell wall biosynthesis
MPVSISVIVPVHNSAKYLRACLEHLRRSNFQDYECIVVDDGSTDDSPEVAQRAGVTVLKTDARRGPAYARNIGAKSARGEILFFIDADVCVSPNTLERVSANFEQDLELSAVMGSYDELPESQDFVSLYKNLMHSYVHHNSRREACTFWSGCGAIRKSVFQEFSGFDESYDRPAIEDIELGYRLSAARKKLLLDPTILVKHLKRWSFFSLVKTDILDRGIPWTELILRDRVLPNDLNLQLSQRVSVALVFLLILMAAFATLRNGRSFALSLLTLLFLLLAQFGVESRWRTQPKAMLAMLGLMASIVGLAWAADGRWLIPPVLIAYAALFVRHRYAFKSTRARKISGALCGAYLIGAMAFVLLYLPYERRAFWFYLVLVAVILINSQFYVFLAGRTGRLLALAAIPFHLLYHFYNGISFAIGMTRHLSRRVFTPEDKAVSKSVSVSPDS